MSYSWLGYLRVKAIISYLRYSDPERPAVPRPDDSFRVPSRGGRRMINVNVYRPSNIINPSPVLINWNGCAFVFDAHGADEPFCRRIADEAGYTVLDASYALAPEHPFPAALEDAQDLILHVMHQSTMYDTKRIVLGGFSSGGNIALAAAADLVKSSQIHATAIRAIVAFYPPTDMTVYPADKRTRDGSLPQMSSMMRIIIGAFKDAYLPPGMDAADPRVSVLEGEVAHFPGDLFIITAEKDRLTPEAEALATKLQNGGKHVVLKRFEGVGHGWDKTGHEDSHDARVRDEAYKLVVGFLLGFSKEPTE